MKRYETLHAVQAFGIYKDKIQEELIGRIGYERVSQIFDEITNRAATGQWFAWDCILHEDEIQLLRLLSYKVTTIDRVMDISMQHFKCSISWLLGHDR